MLVKIYELQVASYKSRACLCYDYEKSSSNVMVMYYFTHLRASIYEFKFESYNLKAVKYKSKFMSYK